MFTVVCVIVLAVMLPTSAAVVVVEKIPVIGFVPTTPSGSVKVARISYASSRASPVNVPVHDVPLRVRVPPKVVHVPVFNVLYAIATLLSLSESLVYDTVNGIVVDVGDGAVSDPVTVCVVPVGTYVSYVNALKSNVLVTESD